MGALQDNLVIDSDTGGCPPCKSHSRDQSKIAFGKRAEAWLAGMEGYQLTGVIQVLSLILSPSAAFDNLILCRRVESRELDRC
ncbi:MAG: hypothetical protein DMF61_03595 [Blastocatellia bacterium AA13]|nr:MAG: hypothetical protein DMF61_03595 [Blastocatellia bacterium AA13]